MILLPGSGDPQHRGHYNIIKKAEKAFNKPVDYLIVQSPAKDNGLLSLQERYKDALISFFSYGVRDGEINRNNKEEKYTELINKIHTASTMQEIIYFMGNADQLIRGIRNEEDKEYSLKLLSQFGKPEWLEKSSWLDQDEEYKNTSSTEYKKAYGLLSNKGEIILPEIYHFVDAEKIMNQCKETIKNIDITFNIKKLEGEIVEYFDLVNNLTELGWYNEIFINKK